MTTEFLIRGKPSTVGEISSAFETVDSVGLEKIARVKAESKRQLFLYVAELESVEGKGAHIDWIRVVEDEQEWLTDYDKTVFDSLTDQTWVCDAHGELEVENIGVSVGGHLLCEICSIAREAQADQSIDPKIEMKLDDEP